MKKLFLLILLSTGTVLLLSLVSKQKLKPPETSQPTAVVENYLKATLGTIPEAKINYEAAKKYLTSDLVTKFNGPGFVPLSYCIQDGPQNVRIKPGENLGDKTAVKVEASWGDEWTERLEFVLTKESGQWKINKINCLYKP